jgi:hypothetical protein
MLRSVLPSESVTALRLTAQTAQAAFLKNVTLYFLPLVSIVWLVPFHFVVQVHRQLETNGPTSTAVLPDSPPGVLRHSHSIYIPFRMLVWAVFVVSIASIVLTQDLLGKLVPGPYANLFMMLALIKTFTWCCLGLLCLCWYNRALGEFS